MHNKSVIGRRFFSIVLLTGVEALTTARDKFVHPGRMECMSFLRQLSEAL
jgi:hypothetical protein